MKTLIKYALYIISLPVISRMYGWLTKRENPKYIVKKVMEFFVRTYGINMEEFQGELSDYNSLSKIFVRKLDPEVRPLKKNKKFILSPADGILSRLEVVSDETALQIKGIKYNLSELVNFEIDFSEGWYVSTIYLSPKDYHRFHFPVSGRLKSFCHLQGRLFPVNSLGLNYIKELFLKNERIAVKIGIRDSNLFFVAVGATFVGSIKMEFIEKYKRDNVWKPVDVEVSQLGEMGRFELGSTIVMLFPQKLAEPLIKGLNKKIKVGDKLFLFK